MVLAGGPLLVGLVFLVGALLPSSGPGVVGAAQATSVTITGVMSWFAVGVAALLTLGGWELGAAAGAQDDRTWALGVRLVGGLAVAGALGVAIGRTAAPQIAWATVAGAGGPIAGALLIVLTLLCAERLRLIGDRPAAVRVERGAWALGTGCLLLLDRLAPETLTIRALFGPAASTATLFLVAAGIYGAVLLGGGLARLARNDGEVPDLGVHDG